MILLDWNYSNLEAKGGRASGAKYDCDLVVDVWGEPVQLLRVLGDLLRRTERL